MKLPIALFVASTALMTLPNTASADWWSKGSASKDTTNNSNDSSDWWGKGTTAKKVVEDTAKKVVNKSSTEDSDENTQKDSKVAVKIDTKNTVQKDAKVVTATANNTAPATPIAPVAPVAPANSSAPANNNAPVKANAEKTVNTINNKKAGVNILFQGTGTTDQATANKLKRMVDSQELPNAKVKMGAANINNNGNPSWNMNMPAARFNQQAMPQTLQPPMPQAMTYIPLRALTAQGYVPQIQMPQMWGQMPQFNMQQEQAKAPTKRPSFEEQQAMMEQMRIQFETMALRISERQKAAAISYKKYQASQKQSMTNDAPANSTAPIAPAKSAQAPAAETTSAPAKVTAPTAPAKSMTAPEVPSTPAEKTN
ncbi:MAG: hypothetical protein V3U71_03440 [Cocleimonas sp.]